MFMPYARSVVHSASSKRLQALLQERINATGTPAAEAIDRRIWDLFGQTWSVMFTDLSGFSRQVAKFGIIHFLQIIHESLRVFTPCLDRHDGILLKVEADSLLVLFRHPARAMACAIDMQRACRDYNVGRPPEEHVLLCVGLGHGEMLRVGDEDVFGAEVNAASKLGEDTAKAGEILVTDQFRAQLGHQPHLTFSPLEGHPPGAIQGWKADYSIEIP
jgi:adenylate cyclase